MDCGRNEWLDEGEIASTWMVEDDGVWTGENVQTVYGWWSEALGRTTTYQLPRYSFSTQQVRTVENDNI